MMRPQRYNPDVEAWRIVLACAFLALYCAVRSMFRR